MIVQIEIHTDNDAFQPEPEYEVARLLHQLASWFRGVPGTLDYHAMTGEKYFFADENGNICGKLSVKETPDDFQNIEADC